MTCTKLFEELDAVEAQYLDVLEDVCNIESPTNFKDGVDRTVDYFLDMARAKGWQTEIFEHPVAGNAACITLNPHADKAPICLSGHLDTVHPVGSFGSLAVRRDEKNMYGPGVMDCKGGAVAAFMAMDALERVGFTSRPVRLILQSDEETSSITSQKATIDYMCRKAEGAVAFLNLEGHVRGTAVLVRKGIIRYRFTVRGRALHSARCFNAANAIAEAAHKIIRLEKMKDAYGLTCNCGVISGGTVPNTVAEKCVFVVDIRFANDAQLEKARNEIAHTAEECHVEGCSCEVEELSFRPAMPLTDKNEELLARMNEIYAQSGIPTLTARSCLSGSDAAYITEIGVPCIDCIGTLGGNIHSTDEYMELDSLKVSAKMIAAVVHEI